MSFGDILSGYANMLFLRKNVFTNFIIYHLSCLQPLLLWMSTGDFLYPTFLLHLLLGIVW